MCGIAGTIDVHEAPSREQLRAMAAPLACRGPDDERVMVRGDCGLAHRRLAVIDPAGGAQPLLNEDESLGLICNGEIYEYQSWRKELEARGHSFRTGSDNEVILHLYEEQGRECIQLLNGMFAFAIFHFQTRQVFMSRDRFGQKPLFYAMTPGRIALASGTRSLLQLPWIKGDLDYTAIHDYLEYQYVPAPRSIYQGIRKLMPGNSLMWDAERGVLEKGEERAGDSGFNSSPGSAVAAGSDDAVLSDFNATAGEIRNRFATAVERRLVADVPVGMFLSGGMDSGLVCAAAQRMSTRAIRTFSIGFPVPEYDERREAARVADYLGTEHHVLEVNPADVGHLRWLTKEFEEPFCDASMLPMSLLSKFTGAHVKVALSGDGADELFGGYDRYRVMNWLKNWSRLPLPLRHGVRRGLEKSLPAAAHERTRLGRLRRVTGLLDREGQGAYRELLSRFPEELRCQMYGEAMAAAGDRRAGQGDTVGWDGGDWAAAAMAMDLADYLPNDILVKVDRASMAHGLEVRSPFLDPELADLALSIPRGWKLKRGCGKHILRQSFKGYLPAATFARGKMGFGVPLAHWLRGPWEAMLRELLPGGKTVALGIFRGDRLEWMIDQHCREGRDYSYPLFAILVLELWLRG